MPRWIVLALVLALLFAPRAVRAGDRDGVGDPEPALVSAEIRAGYGVAAGGGAGRASVRGSPLVLAARVAIAIRAEPRVSGYGGLVLETLDRTGAGGEAGLALEPTPRLRLRAGAIAMVAPYQLWGGALGGGRCTRPGGIRWCVDLDADVFVGGSDLPAGGAAFQLLVAIGVGFDAQ